MVMTTKTVHHFEFVSDEVAKKISDKGYTTDLKSDEAQEEKKKALQQS